ncbi:MAG: SIS domain-containing protein [Verrucomicrobia bacterium]|nr:SIS domain-containing protein [Verrucomicrobiota bacterium]
MSFLDAYFADITTLVADLDHEAMARALNAIKTAYAAGRHVFLCGNGGSSATAAHMVNDLTKMPMTIGKKGVRALNLSDNVPLLMAISNDIDYADIFVMPLKAHFERGDIVLGISASGNSENVIRAVEYANANGGVTIGLCGFTGGRLHDLAQIPIYTANNKYGPVEDAHCIVLHALAYWFIDELKRES